MIAHHVIINRLGGEPVRAAADDHLQPEILDGVARSIVVYARQYKTKKEAAFEIGSARFKFERLPEAECTVGNRELGPDRKPPSSQTRSIAFQDCVLSRTPWVRPTNSFELSLIKQLAPALGAAAIGLWCKPSESMKRTLGNIVRLKRRELHSRLPAPYCL